MSIRQRKGNQMPLKLGIPRETASGERRVSMDPAVLSQLTKLGIKVFIQKGAGDSAFFDDASYKEAIIVEDIKELSEISDVIWRVQAPSPEEVNLMREGSVLIGTLMAHDNIAMLKAIEDKKISSFSMELIPRISRAQSMNVLSSQGAIAGYKAAIMAADLAPKFFPMLTSAAGTMRPAKVVVIGAGVAGLQAIATAKRLGAIVEAYDVRPETKERIESLGAKAINLEVSAIGSDGFAHELSVNERHQQQQQLANYISNADVLISTASRHAKSAPKVIPQSTVEMMKQGSVIIDLTAENGGNCSLTQPGKTITYQGVIIHGPLDVASQVPNHASQMYARNLFNFMSLLIDDKSDYVPNFEDEIVIGALLTKDGEVMHEDTLELLNKTLGEKS